METFPSLQTVISPASWSIKPTNKPFAMYRHYLMGSKLSSENLPIIILMIVVFPAPLCPNRTVTSLLFIFIFKLSAIVIVRSGDK